MWTGGNIELVGLAAGLFTTCAALPQIVHAVRIRSMRDVSMTMLAAMFAGLTLWLMYGVLLHSISLIVWNAVTLGLYVVLLTLKLRLDGLIPVKKNSPDARLTAAGGLPGSANFVKDVER